MSTDIGNTAYGDETPETIDLLDGSHAYTVVNIEGAGGDDTLSGDGQSNIINGGTGNDTITGGLGLDILSGGDGDDAFILTGEVNDPAYNQEGGLTTYFTGNLYDGGAGMDMLRAGEDNLTLVLTDTAQLGNSSIEAIDGTGKANFHVSGDAGGNSFDFTDIRLDNVTIDGNVGDDVITGSSANRNGNGASGDDRLEGGYGDDTVVMHGNSADFEFTIDNDTGRLRVTDLNATGEDTGSDLISGFETLHFDDGLGNTQDIDIAMTDTVDTDGASGATVAEHIADGTAVGIDLAASASADLIGLIGVEAATPTFRFAGNTGNPNNIFAIDPVTGVVTVADSAKLDFESATDFGDGTFGYEIYVEATTAGVVSTPVSYRVLVTDANDPPVDVQDSDALADEVAEGAVNGTQVGITVQAIDPNSDNVSYSLADDAGGRFTIDPGSGVVTVANGALLDFETQASWNITVLATDSLGASTDQVFTINLTDATTANWTGTVGADVFTATNGEAWTLDGGADNDVIVGADLGDTITGGEGNDTLVSLAGDDVFRYSGTNGGMDDIFGGTGYDKLEATADNTVIGINSMMDIEEIYDGGFQNVSLQASDNNDNLDLSNTYISGTVRIDAGAGDDTVIGSTGNDMIDGQDGNDSLYGGSGDDSFLYSGVTTGFDAVDGGDGYDRLVAGGDNTVVSLSVMTGIEDISTGGFTNLTLQGSADDSVFDFSNITFDGAVTIRAGAGADTVTGWSGDDVIFGEDGDDLIIGGAGADTLNGGNGLDTLSYQGALEAINVNLATNVVSGGDATGDVISSFENVIATDYDDTITGSGGVNVITGGAGNDIMNGGAGNDTFRIGLNSGTDAINGGTGTDTVLFTEDYATLTVSSLSAVEIFDASAVNGATIVGNELNNSLNFSAATLTNIVGIYGMGGNDTITGSAAADTIIGGAGNDTLNGGNGDDVFRFEGGDEGFDAFNGGAGFDTIEATAYGATIGMRSITGIEQITGYGDTIILGNSSANTLNFSTVTLSGIAAIDGGGGNDIITGSVDQDTIYGGTGADRITGGEGADMLFGGTGNDTFDFNAISESQFGGNVDQIEDFVKGQDKIDITTIDADTGLVGDQNFVFLGSSAFTGTAGELRFDNSLGDGLTHIFGDIDGNGIADFEVSLTGTYTLVNTNFIL